MGAGQNNNEWSGDAMQCHDQEVYIQGKVIVVGSLVGGHEDAVAEMASHMSVANAKNTPLGRIFNLWF